MRFSKQIRAAASLSALIALLSAGTAVQAAPDYRSLAKSVYGDEECASILMSADLGVGLSSVPPDVFSGVKPKNTACVLLQSFVRMPGATIASREIVGVQGAEFVTPQTFAMSKIPSLRANNGEIAATVRIALVAPSSDGVAANADSTEDSDDGVIWRIAYNDQSYDLTWEPVDVGVNPVTDEPYVTGANGRMWTPGWTKVYQTWDAKGEAPVVRAIDSKGNLLVTSLVYDRLTDIWMNDRYVGRYSDVDRNAAMSFADPASAEAYYPGYVMTFSDALGFDAKDRLVVYRQEGRVFTRTAYALK